MTIGLVGRSNLDMLSTLIGGVNWTPQVKANNFGVGTSYTANANYIPQHSVPCQQIIKYSNLEIAHKIYQQLSANLTPVI